MAITSRIWNYMAMTRGDVGRSLVPNGPARGDRAASRGAANNVQGRRPRQGSSRPSAPQQSNTPNAWFPLTHPEMNATLENGQSSRRVALLPIPAIEQIRAVLRDPNSPLPSGQQKLNDLFGSMERKMGKDLSGPGAHVVRLGWRVALMAGATAVWLSTLAGTLAMLAGGVGAATWLTLHQQLFRQWRGLDDNRVRQAVQERRKSLRAPFDEKKKERLKQQSARFGAYVVLLAFCPVGFLAETGARMGRNMRLRFMKRGVEQQRDELETQVNNERARIESYAERNRQSRVIELPENIPPGPAAYDSYYHASNTPPSRVQPEPAAAGVSLAADDPRRRRRRAGLSL